MSREDEDNRLRRRLPQLVCCAEREAVLVDSDPEVVFGPARVIGITDPVSVTAAEPEGHGIEQGERLLFRTSNSDRSWSTDDSVEDCVYVSEDAAARLAERNTRLVGIDYLSVGGFDVDGAAIHRRLLEPGCGFLEGLDLPPVSPGRYEIVRLPLRLAGAEGGPARVLLRPRGDPDTTITAVGVPFKPEQGDVA